MALFYCSQIITAAPEYVSPVHDQAKREAARIIDELRWVARQASSDVGR